MPTFSGGPSGANSKRGGKFNAATGFFGPEHELNALTPMTPTALIAAALARNFRLEKFDSLMVHLVLWFSTVQYRQVKIVFVPFGFVSPKIKTYQSIFT
jgi:hypothetical protein